MSLLNAAIGIFTVANPIGNLPIYLSFTDGERSHDRAIARSSSITFLVALLIATWLGNEMLDIFGISRGAFQIAGGLIVVLIGISMLRAKPPEEHHDPDSVDRDKSSSVKGVVPIGIPLLAGPGTLTVAIADPISSSIEGKTLLSIVVLVMALLIYLIFELGELLSSRISISTMQVLTKVMGMLLTSIAIQMFLDGLKISFPSIA